MPQENSNLYLKQFLRSVGEKGRFGNMSVRNHQKTSNSSVEESSYLFTKLMDLIRKLLANERKPYSEKHQVRKNYSKSSPGVILDNLKAGKIQWRKSGSVTSSELAEDNIEPVS